MAAGAVTVILPLSPLPRYPYDVRTLFAPVWVVMSCPFWTRGGWMRRRVFDNPAKRAWWQVHVDAQRESGLTASKYCRQHRLLTRTFQIWRRELTAWEEEKITRHLKIGRAACGESGCR